MQIGMLGSFEVRTGDGVYADVPGARLRGLLVALALEPGQVVPKARLVDWIWGENPPAEAANALQRLVSRLRKVLPAGVVEGLPDGYRLRVEPDAVDAVRFERLVSQARNGEGQVQLLRDALASWRGAALQDVGLTDSAAYDAVVTRLERLRLAAMEDRFDAELDLGSDVLAELTDLAAAHPVRERLAVALMRALVAAGRDSEALLVYERTREALADALGVDPSPELSAVHVALLRGKLPRSEEKQKTNLRAELTSYVGKNDDITAVRDLIANHRLTTLLGPGGAGKTRLATETARTLVGDRPDGVWMVELAPIGVDSDVAQATLGALGLRDSLLSEAADLEPTDRVINALRNQDALLILDNCEHVIASAAEFAHRVLGECHHLRILVTSREPLSITGEALWRVVPLALPEDDGDAESSPAVQLFRERASAVRVDLGTDARTSASMARVCQALDGMPLAIELAAARLRTMSLDQLADRLDDVFRLLTGGSRTALPRQRTLRAVIDWSWELLNHVERTVLSRLSVFAGGASLEAAERVCASDTIDPRDVLELLTALTEKSLVVAEGNQVPRYRMLGTIKEYAAQQLLDANESPDAQHAHLAYFTELAKTAEPHLRRAEQLQWLAVLRTEHANIAAAMRNAIAAADAPGAMRLAAVAGWYWWLSGHKSEGNELVLAATEVPGEVPDEIRATVYAIVVMFLSSGPGDEHRAKEWIHETYRITHRLPDPRPFLQLVDPMERMLESPGDFLPAWEPLLDNEDPWVRALARLQLGKMRVVLGHPGLAADSYLKEALAEFQAIGERFGISFALSELAERLAARGDFTGACEYYEQAVAVVIEIGAFEDVIPMRSRQAQLHWLLGDLASSAAALAEAQQYAVRVTWPGALGLLEIAKAGLARWAGDTETARQQLEVAMIILGDEAEGASVRAGIQTLLGYLSSDLGRAREHHTSAWQAAAEGGHASVVAQVLVGVADLALRRGQYDQAARLVAAAVAVRGLPDRSLPDEARIEETALSRLGEAKFAEAARDGAETEWTQLVAVTLAS